jgi:hypothetical protein
VVIYSIQAALVVGAVLARYQSDAEVVLLYSAVIVVLFCALTVAERGGWRVPRDRAVQSELSRALAGLRASTVILKGPLLVITAITPLVMLLSAFWMARISSDFAVAAAVLAALCAVQLLWPRAVSPMLLRLAIYATAILPGYLLISYPGAIPRGLQVLIVAVIVVLAAAVALYVRFSGEQRFRTTPTDYLIVCGAVALTAFGSVAVNSQKVVEAVLFAIVLMYACEVIVAGTPGSSSRRLLQYSTLGALLIITFRGTL